MNEILQYIHYPNVTELGEGKTHETYMLVPTSLEVSSLFPDKKEQKFYHHLSGKTYLLKAAVGREYRINQLGQFYRDNNIKFGDAVVCTKITDNGVERLHISVVKGNYVGFIPSSKGVEIINNNRLCGFVERANSPFRMDVIYKGKHTIIEFAYKKSEKKRNDSPTNTDYYSCQIGGENLKGIIFIDVDNNHIIDLDKKAEYIKLNW